MSKFGRGNREALGAPPSTIDEHPVLAPTGSPDEVHNGLRAIKFGMLGNDAPMSIFDIAASRDLDEHSPVPGYTRIGSADNMQHFPSDKNGNVIPGLIGVISMPHSSPQGSGIEPETVMLFDYDYMPYNYGRLVIDKELRKSKLYNPERQVTGLTLIFKNTPDVPHPFADKVEGQDYESAGSWVLEDVLKGDDPHHRTGGVSIKANIPDPEQPGASIPFEQNCLITHLAEVEAMQFRHKHATAENPDGYKDQIDFIVETLGMHLDPSDEFDYHEDRKLPGKHGREITSSDVAYFDNYLNAHHRDPLALVATLIAHNEMLSLELEEDRARRETTGRFLEHNLAAINDRRDEVREEVLQALAVMKIASTTKIGGFDTTRWTAKLITPYDIQALGVLADNPNLACRYEAARAYEALKELDQTLLNVTPTEGNKMTMSLSYKPGQHAVVSDKAYAYSSGSTGTVPVDMPNGAFPPELVASVFDNELSNMVPGIIGEHRVTTGPHMSSTGGERRLFIDGMTTYNSVARGALEYAMVCRRIRRTQGIDAIVPQPPSLYELLAHKEPVTAKQERMSRLVLMYSKNSQLSLLSIVYPGRGVEFVRSANGHKITFRPTELIETERDKGVYDVVPTTPAVAGETVQAGLAMGTDGRHTVYAKQAITPDKIPTQFKFMPNDPGRLEALRFKYNPRLRSSGRDEIRSSGRSRGSRRWRR